MKQEETAHPIYAGAKEGPFRCDHCEYSHAAATKCSRPEIISLRKGVIEPGACCDYFEKGHQSTKFTADDVKRAVQS